MGSHCRIMPRLTMSAVLCAVVVCSMLQGVVGSQAWSEFEAGHVSHQEASSSRRLMAHGVDSGSYAASVQVQPIGGNVETAFQRFVTVNSFIADGNTNSDGKAIQKRILDLCKAGAAGTEFSYMNTSQYNSAKTQIADPLCYYCLTRGYGTTDNTPGFYLPCGCQRSCVDVSGFTKGSFESKPGEAQFFGSDDAHPGFPYLSNSFAMKGVYKAGGGNTMNSCQDYIDNKIVTTCNEMFIYHFVLWPSVLGGIALLYSAYSIAAMPLDMDSLLYTVGSSSKKDS